MDRWIHDGPATLDRAKLTDLRRIVDDESPVVVEYRLFHGSRAPHRFVCDDAEELERYVLTSTAPGDHLLFWRFADCCTDASVAVKGTVPDHSGRIPVGGAY